MNLLNDDTSENEQPERIQLSVEYIQPWSNFICKIKLPDEIYVELQKINVDRKSMYFNMALF